MSIYGNIKNNLKAPFVFDKIYPNRVMMDANVALDGIFINRYVLINYTMLSDGTQLFDDNNLFKNQSIDRNEYESTYHLTAWIKVGINGLPQYIMAGELEAKAPDLDLYIDAPSETLTPFIDYYHSSNASYVIHIPRLWNISLKTDNNDLNKSGFNARILNYIENPTNSILTSTTSSGEYAYYDISYEPILLTADTYEPGKYYCANTSTPINYSELSLSTNGFNNNLFYFTKTYTSRTTTANDTKEFHILAQSLGNAVSELYDSLYGLPQLPQEQELSDYSFLGYSTTNNYSTIIDENATEVIIGSSTQTKYYLTDTDLLSLSHIIKSNTSNYPIYSTTPKMRPYILALLFNYDNITPYDNLNKNDPISMAWALEELKLYISELRYLAEDPSRGLLSDWTNNIADSFGYIHNKPQVISITAVNSLWDTIYADTNISVNLGN